MKKTKINANTVINLDTNKMRWDTSVNEKLLTNLNEETMVIEEEKKFNSNFMNLPDTQKNNIMEEIQKFINNENGNIIFINHIRSILIDRKHYNTFSPESMEIIKFLDYLAKNNLEKLQEILRNFNQVSKNPEK